MIKHTDLVGILARPIVRTAAPEVVMPPLRDHFTPLGIEIITRTQITLTPAARAFLSAIRTMAAQWAATAPMGEALDGAG